MLNHRCDKTVPNQLNLHITFILFLILFVSNANVGFSKIAVESDEEYREAMNFLMANMPENDRKILSKKFLTENTNFAYKALKQVPWGDRIPKDIFLNYVLPYCNLNERRDNWRPEFYKRFLPLALQSGSIEEAVKTFNQEIFKLLDVSYDAKKRPKPDQSPFESMHAKYASCTGLSILLVDALRSVAIPARIVLTPLWINQSGNHTWVEVWDNGNWFHIGANEPSNYNEVWFSEIASKANSTKPEHRIYATSFKKTDLMMPLVWDKSIDYVYALDVTGNYALKNITVGMSRENFAKIYPKSKARTYRTKDREEWITFDDESGQKGDMITFHFRDDILTDFKVNYRPEVVEEYLSEYCSQIFIQSLPKTYKAIEDALNLIPQEAFLSITNRARPTLFTEYHYTGMGRFANSSEIFSFPDDAPSFEDGMTIIKLSTELEDTAQTPEEIEGIILHELAHRYWEHAKNQTELCQREREANKLVKEWGFEKQFEQTKSRFGEPNSKLHDYCRDKVVTDN